MVRIQMFYQNQNNGVTPLLSIEYLIMQPFIPGTGWRARDARLVGIEGGDTGGVRFVPALMAGLVDCRRKFAFTGSIQEENGSGHFRRAVTPEIRYAFGVLVADVKLDSRIGRRKHDRFRSNPG